jgi:alpha-galactosidase
MAGPGGWNYPDSLEIGNAKHGKGFTPAEARAHFSLWSITSSPLILGNDLRNMTADDLAVVSNKDAIMVNQAWAGYAGDLLNFTQYPPANASKVNVTNVPPHSVWWKPLPNKSAAAVLFNSNGGTTTATLSFRFDELVWNGAVALQSANGCHVRSVWDDGKEVGVFDGGFSVPVGGSSVFFAIIEGCQ